MPSLVPPSALSSFIHCISNETPYKPVFITNATLLDSLLDSFITAHGLSTFVPLSPDIFSYAFYMQFTRFSSFSQHILWVVTRLGHRPPITWPRHSYSSRLISSPAPTCSPNSSPTSPTHVSISCVSNHTECVVSGSFLLPHSHWLDSKYITLRSSQYPFCSHTYVPTVLPMSLDLPVTISLPKTYIRMLPSYCDDMPDIRFCPFPSCDLQVPCPLYRHFTIRRLSHRPFSDNACDVSSAY